MVCRKPRAQLFAKRARPARGSMPSAIGLECSATESRKARNSGKIEVHAPCGSRRAEARHADHPGGRGGPEVGHRRTLIAATLAVATLTAACSSSSSPKHDPTSPPDPTSTTSTTGSSPASTSTAASTSSSAATTATVEQAAQSTWLNFWRVSLSLGTYPQVQWPKRVAAVTVEPSYSQVLNSVRGQLVGQGEVGYGYIVSHPSWPTPPKADAKALVMADCYDGTHAGSKVLKTGKQRTVGKARTNVRVTMTLGADGKWRVKQTVYLKASC